MTPKNEIKLKPTCLYAFLKSLSWTVLSVALLFLAWRLSNYFIVFSLSSMAVAWYRFLLMRSHSYTITAEVLRMSRGIFFKRTDQVEMYRVKDYIITRSFVLQVFGLMNLTLKSTDPENPIIHLSGIPVSDIVETIREHVQEARKLNCIYEIN